MPFLHTEDSNNRTISKEYFFVKERWKITNEFKNLKCHKVVILRKMNYVHWRDVKDYRFLHRCRHNINRLPFFKRPGTEVKLIHKKMHDQ